MFRLPSLSKAMRPIAGRSPMNPRILSVSIRSMSQVHVSEKAQAGSPLAPVGVEAALKAKEDPTFKPRTTLFKEFDLTRRVGMVTGGNRGLGLEMAMTLCEAGATVYCLDLPKEPGDDFKATKAYVERMGLEGVRLEYLSVDTTDQTAIWGRGQEIADKEGRMDVCIAAAGILHEADCLEYPAADFRKVMDVNANGVLFTAQAAGRQMARFGTPGSIILIASMSGSVTNKAEKGVFPWAAYNTSKSAVIQLARSLACELGPQKIRVNSLSPGHIYTKMTAAYLDSDPKLYGTLSGLNPLGRLGRPDELRGVIAWLASDASTFCTGSDILVSGGHHSW